MWKRWAIGVVLLLLAAVVLLVNYGITLSHRADRMRQERDEWRKGYNSLEDREHEILMRGVLPRDLPPRYSPLLKEYTR